MSLGMEGVTATSQRVQDVLVRSQARVREFDQIASRRSGLQPPIETIETTPTGQAVPSRRETDLLRLIVAGLSNKEIAGRLILSEDTVKSHVRNLLVKLNARNRAHAVALGFERGLIELPTRRAA